MITNGQARRISAEWQAPYNACSSLQHQGYIEPILIEEINKNLLDVKMRGEWVHDGDAGVPAGTTVAELIALRDWAEEQGVGQVENWGAWDDTHVGVPA